VLRDGFQTMKQTRKKLRGAWQQDYS
jgi:hypothetical protein